MKLHVNNLYKVVACILRVIPGQTFGMKDKCYLRVAYGALRKDTAAEGISRLVRGLKQLLGR